MKRFFWAGLLFLSVCSFAFATSMIPKEVGIDDSANGTEKTIFLGQTLTISLGENPSTGYRWTVEDFKPAVLEQLEAVFKPSGSGAVGSGGTRVFGFLAKKVGETVVKLENQRPWAETAPPAKTFSVTLKVVKAGGPHNVQMADSPRPGPLMTLGMTLSEISAVLADLKADELAQTSVVEFFPGEVKDYRSLIVITDPKRLPKCPNEKLPMNNKALRNMVKNLLTHYGAKAKGKTPAFLLGGFCQPGYTQVTLVGTGLGLYFNIQTGEPMGKLTGKL